MNGESRMSNSMFDFNVMLESTVEGGEAAVRPAFTVSGVLGQEECPGEPKAPQTRDLSVLVSVWQTKEDAEDGSRSPTEIFARALGVGKQVPDQLEKWSARLEVKGRTNFRLGRPATGAALIVENTGDPTAFETYAWTGRLQIGNDTLLVANP
jgi:hypothetical protein